MILLILVIVGTFALPLLYNDAILLYYGDAIEIVYPYFLHFHQQIQNGTFSFWNHSMGLGTNNIANLINALGSPFLYLGLLFPLNFLKHYFLLADALRFFLTGVFAYLWFSKLFKTEQTRISLALLYTFSGWALNFVIFTFYLDAYMYLPLLLFLSEESLEGRKQLWFSIVIAFVSFYSLYFLYMFSIFLFIYHIYRFLTLENRDLKILVGRIVNLLSYYILGLLLISFAFVPSIQVFLSTPRIESNILEGLRFDLNPLRIYNFISSFFSPVMSDYNTNLFMSRDISNYGSVFYVFTSSLTVLGVLNLVLIRFKEKRTYLFFLITLLVLSFIPAANVLMNGNQHIRWHFMIMIFMLMGLGYFLENQAKPKWVYLFTLVQLFALSAIAFISLKRNFVYSEHQHFYLVYVSFLFVVIVLYGFGFTQWKKRSYLLYGLLVIEMIAMTNIRMHVGPDPRYIKKDSFDQFEYFQNAKLFDRIKINDDDEYYRIDVQNASGNYPLLKNYRSFTFYSSLYNHSIRSLLDGRFSDNWNIGYRPSLFIFKHFLGNRYVVTEKDKDLSDFGYQYDSTLNDKDIYISDYPVRLGYVIYNTVNLTQWGELDKSIQDFWMYSHVAKSDGDMMIEPKYSPILIKENMMDDFIRFSDLGKGYWIIDYSRTNVNTQCQVDFYLNETLIQSQNINEFGYAYIKDENTFDGAYVYCRGLYNKNEIVPSNVYFASNALLDSMYTDLSNYETFDYYRVKGDQIDAEITIKAEGANVIMSMAYDAGWNVRANGERIDTFLANDGLLAFKLDPGTYSITMVYTPLYFKLGVVLSLSGFTLMGLNIIKKWRSKHEKR